ncbi:hypothetical protein FRC10_001444 [Ceratobasidium sp. 414]|nr:hypothetical protein FRC10_001444 [Ceratobasidium sp. 414]
MSVSKAFRKLVCREWNGRWPVPPPNRLIIVRPIAYFERVALPADLSSFRRLRFASLNFDNAFQYRDNAWHLLPLVSRLPESLKELEFFWSHASERDVIRLVGELCPTITTLRLVFCTMFNNPKCLWWPGHQGQADHHYLKTHDLSEVGQYAANHIAHHSAKDAREYIDHIDFQNVIHFNADWAIRHPGIPPPDTTIDRLAPLELWEKACPACAEEWAGAIKLAERRAASILALRARTLSSVSFASFVAERRTAPSEWAVSRVVEYVSTGGRTKLNPGAQFLAEYPEDARLHVYTKRRGAHCSLRVAQVFRWSAEGWVMAQD